MLVLGERAQRNTNTWPSPAESYVATNKLTDRGIRAAKTTEKTQKLSDGDGLQLWLMPTGAKLWRVAYRYGGKQKLLALGKYPDLSLTGAREA
ncbi:MAG: DUF4102 domain-containing protein, partial [Alphaproteobacteria bacterium]